MDSNISISGSAAGPCSPFDLDSTDAYEAWRDRKLEGCPRRLDELVVELRDPQAPSSAERRRIVAVCRRANMVVLATGRPAADKAALRALGRSLGLARLDSNPCADADGISTLQVRDGGRHAEYIPYTNRPLSWHTDGYYNPPHRQIRAWMLYWMLYCVQSAARGGANELLDHEMLYISMREADPAHVAALMAPDAMTIPANREDGREIRPASVGPVFSVDPRSGALHMRYTARRRNVQWKQDAATRAAGAWLEDLFFRGSAPIFRHRLEPGQGILSNNVLHRRDGFDDDASGGGARIVLRARYYDRIAGT
jgi:hypothetical protein